MEKVPSLPKYILDTRFYEVEYLDGHKASLAANNIAENIFSQVDE